MSGFKVVTPLAGFAPSRVSSTALLIVGALTDEPTLQEKWQWQFFGRQICSFQCSASTGFSHHALYVYRPRSAQAHAAAWRADPTFPREIHTRDFLKFTLRHQRRARSLERQIAGGLSRARSRQVPPCAVVGSSRYLMI
jgi:hypothetical protein